MTTNKKKQVFVFAGACVLLGLGALLLWHRAQRRVVASAPAPSITAPRDSLSYLAPDSLALAPHDSSLDNSSSAGTPAATALPESTFVRTSVLTEEPQISDTLRRYGSHATTMQMLVELLEEKQLLMEQKVELARRLEITEILDSALVVSQQAHDSSAAALDQQFSDQLDSLTQKFPLAPTDSLSETSSLPPRE